MKKVPGHQGSMRDAAVMVLAGLGVAAAVVTDSKDAAACGACYSSSSESTVVNDHRMAFSIGRQQTVLWDSITYSGNPKEFAYVLPAKPGTRLEPSNESFFTALDMSTRPIIMGPQPTGGGGFGGGGGGDYSRGSSGYGYNGSYGDDTSAGCGCSSEDSAAAMAGGRNAGSPGSSGSSADASAAGSPEPPPVEVVDQAVVGPYETVTVRSTQPDELEKWLKEHGYAIPPESSPIIASYVELGFDFIAMRLQPGQNVRAMQPIRIVSPGTDISLPLRLMQIGAGAHVGITLYVIGEGRYHTANFPDVSIDFDKLIWDFSQGRSNYQELSKAAMAQQGERAFITEYADHPSFDPDMVIRSGMTSNLGLVAAYKQACESYGVKRPPPDAGPDATATDAGDAGDPDAASDPDASADPDAGDASASADAGPPRVVGTYCDDIDVAFESMSKSDAWVTRLRANLPRAALADTLRLEPYPKQERLDNIHQTKVSGTIQARIARMRAERTHGTYALIGLTALVVARIIRRKKKK